MCIPFALNATKKLNANVSDSGESPEDGRPTAKHSAGPATTTPCALKRILGRHGGPPMKHMVTPVANASKGLKGVAPLAKNRSAAQDKETSHHLPKPDHQWPMLQPETHWTVE
jgi:hypothetical protein